MQIGILVLTLVLVASPLTAQAQQPGKVPRVGVLALFGPELGARSVAAVREGLDELGWREGRNIHLEVRYASGKRDLLGSHAGDLVQQKVDVIVAIGTDPSLAAKRGTSTIPIVMAGVADPVGNGLVASLGRPGGNVTGMALLMTDLIGKQLQLFKEVAPKASRIGVIRAPGRAPTPLWMKGAEAAARHHGVKLYLITLREPLTLDDLAPQLRTDRVDAVLGLAHPALDDVRVRIVDIINAQRLPSVFTLTYWAEAGGLMSYSADLYAIQRRAAAFVDKILRGGNPANLPVEQPTKFELVFNLKTANTMGLTIPPLLLQRADRVIE